MCFYFGSAAAAVVSSIRLLISKCIAKYSRVKHIHVACLIPHTRRKKNEAKVKRKQTTVAVLKIEREEELSNSNRQNAK